MIAIGIALICIINRSGVGHARGSTQSQLEAYGTVELFDDLPQETTRAF